MNRLRTSFATLATKWKTRSNATDTLVGLLSWLVILFSVWYMADYKHEWWSVALVVPAVAGLMMVRSTAVNQYRNAHKHKVTVYTDDLDNVYVASTSGVDVTYKELWPVEAPE